MVSGPSYKRVGLNNDSLMFKYKLAKALTLLSLLAVVIMALCSFLYPQTSLAQNNELATCELPNELFIAKSEDGSYTPPAPDPSLLNAVRLIAPEDVEKYCKNAYDPQHGFQDAMTYNVHGECGNWQESYRAQQKQRLEQLEKLKTGDLVNPAKEAPRFISYLCMKVPVNSNRGCGGLADRMSGMISTFFFALLTDRGYLAHWDDENPIPLEVLFEKPNIDWSFDPDELSDLYNNAEAGISVQFVDTLNQKYPTLGETMFPSGPMQDFQDLWNATYVQVRSNRAYIIRTFKESDRYPPILHEMGLTKENAFGCLADYLFRPTIGSRRFINAYRELFQMDSVLSIGLQIRTDDNALANPQYDHNTLEMWDHFMTCANQLVGTKLQPHHKRIVYFMITDSGRLRDDFNSLNTNRTRAVEYLGKFHNITSTVITGLPLEHIEPEQVRKYINVENPKAVTLERMTPGVNSAVIENWLLSYTDYRVISPQGYGKLAAFHSRSDDSTISMPRYSLKSRAPDCASPDALTSYDWLATQWSLG
ncbi:hypothetical protein BX666DRAFT_2018108 [Dichotomocladium elegans]|nr:hypothetical protein BX666DRAFT_2018108 [Dichotomocladium elegans]